MKNLQIIVQKSDLEKIMNLLTEIKADDLILSDVEFQQRPVLPLIGKQFSMKQISVILENKKSEIFTQKINNLEKSFDGTIKIIVSNVSEVLI